MPAEISAFMNFLQRVKDDSQRRQQEAAQKPAPAMPEWSKRLSPDDFTGETRAALLRAQAGEGATPQLTTEQLSGMVPFDTRTADEKANAPLSSEQLSSMVPFDTRPRQAPASPQRLAPVPSGTRERLSPIPADMRQRMIGQEAPAEPVGRQRPEPGTEGPNSQWPPQRRPRPGKTLISICARH